MFHINHSQDVHSHASKLQMTTDSVVRNTPLCNNNAMYIRNSNTTLTQKEFLNAISQKEFVSSKQCPNVKKPNQHVLVNET